MTRTARLIVWLKRGHKKTTFIEENCNASDLWTEEGLSLLWMLWQDSSACCAVRKNRTLLLNSSSPRKQDKAAKVDFHGSPEVWGSLQTNAGLILTVKLKARRAGAGAEASGWWERKPGIFLVHPDFGSKVCPWNPMCNGVWVMWSDSGAISNNLPKKRLSSIMLVSINSVQRGKRLRETKSSQQTLGQVCNNSSQRIQLIFSVPCSAFG